MQRGIVCEHVVILTNRKSWSAPLLQAVHSLFYIRCDSPHEEEDADATEGRLLELVSTQNSVAHMLVWVLGSGRTSAIDEFGVIIHIFGLVAGATTAWFCDFVHSIVQSTTDLGVELLMS